MAWTPFTAWGIRWVRLGTYATLGMAGWLALHEFSRIIGQITSPDGSQVPGLGLSQPFTNPGDVVDAITTWHAGLVSPELQSLFSTMWVGLLTGDLLFIAGYVGVLLTLVPHYVTTPSAPGTGPYWAAPESGWRGYLWLRVLVFAIAGIDVIEDALHWLIVPVLVRDGGASTLAQAVLVVITYAKWIAVLAFVVGVVIAARRPAGASFESRTQQGPRAVSSFLTALKWHRYQVAILVALFVLMAGSGGDVLDQLPDAQRAWVPLSPGAWPLLVATVAVAAVALACAGLGRVRTAQYQVVDKDKGRTPDRVYWVPIAMALTLGGFALPSFIASDYFVLTWQRFVVAFLVLLVPPVVSLKLRNPNPDADPSLHPATKLTARGVRIMEATGDGLAVAIVSVGFLGFVRSFSVLTVLSDDLWPWLFLALGILGAVTVWPVLAAVLKSGTVITDVPPDTAGETGIRWKLPPMTRWITIALAIIGLALIFFPLWTSARLGLVGTAVIGIGGLFLLLGWLTSWLHPWKPMEFFRLFGLRAAPILSLVLAIGIVGGLIAPRDPQHDIRLATEDATSTIAPSLEEAFTTWTQRSGSDACFGTLDGKQVRPLVLVAASGGGIRAAEWTVQGITRLGGIGCGARSVFLSSGVSGGSVGLTLLATSNTAASGGQTAESAVDAIASPEPLSAGAGGLISADLIAGISGVSMRPPELWGTTGAYDRAALIERSWERLAPGLTSVFTRDLAAGPAGHLVLNSTSAAGLCRVQVSTLSISRLGVTDPDSELAEIDSAPPSCTDGPIANSYQLDAGICLPAVNASTAAMLSARFPVVTPSGIVHFTKNTPQCELEKGESWDQLIDGGYAESTGLGTLIDLAPSLMPLIRAYNSNTGNVPVVPYVVFLENGYGFDAAPGASGGVSEPMVPIRGLSAKAKTGSDTSTLLDRAAEVFRDFDLSSTEPDIPRVAVVAPRSEPRVEAPLGWVLSEGTQTDIRLASAAAFDEPAQDARFSVCPLYPLLGASPVASCS